MSSILADLYYQKPDVAAFSCYIWNRTIIQDIITELPKLLPHTHIWLGGPEVSFHADKLIEHYPQITGIMTGEGEETFVELLKYYWENCGNMDDIKGIVNNHGFTGERELTDMNRLPFLYDTLVSFENRIIYYESQRGCPFRCAYCLSSIDKSVRLRNIDTVKNELQYFIDNKVPQVKFIDRTFNCNSKHALEIWTYLKENDNGVTNFHFEIAADLITDEQLDVMKDMRPGLIQLEIGVQSTNENTLYAINRHMDINNLKRTVSLINSFKNIHQHLDLIAGLPYEDYNSFIKSFNDVYDMSPNQLQLGFLKVLQGSPLEEKADEYGIVYSSKPPYEVLYTKWITYDEILKLKRIEEMVELYYNSGQFSYTLPVLVKEFDSAFMMYSALADYYKNNGYLVNTPARAYRYQVLLDFARSISPDRYQLFCELLTYDMYLRENLKSRPAFACKNNIDQNFLRNFFRKECIEHTYLKGYDDFSSAQLSRMTHMECFTYAVWNSEAPVHLDSPAYILFDYKNRDILTYNAYNIQIYPELFPNP